MLRKLWDYLFPPKNQGCSCCSCCECDEDMEQYWNELQHYTSTNYMDHEYGFSEEDYDYAADDLNYTAMKESR